MLIDADTVLADLRRQALDLTTAANQASLSEARAELLKAARKQERDAIDAAIRDVMREIERVNREVARRDQNWPKTLDQLPEQTELDKLLAAVPFGGLEGLRDGVAVVNGTDPTTLDQLITDVIKAYDEDAEAVAPPPDDDADVVSARVKLDAARATLAAANQALAAHEALAEGLRGTAGALQARATTAAREAERARALGDGIAALRRYWAAREFQQQLAALVNSLKGIDAERTLRRDAVSKAMQAWIDALEAYVLLRNAAVEAHATALAHVSAREQEIDRLLAEAVKS